MKNKKLHIVHSGTRAQIFDEGGTFGEHYIGDLSEESLKAFKEACDEKSWPTEDVNPDGGYGQTPRTDRNPGPARYYDRTTGHNVTSTGAAHPRRLTAEELSKIANFKGGFLNSLDPELAGRCAEYMVEHNASEAVALREVTKDPEMAALWRDHQIKHTIHAKE